MTERLLLVSSDSTLAQSVKSALAKVVSFLQVDNLGEQTAQLKSRFQPTAVIVDSDSRSGVRTAFERIAEAKRQFPSLPVIAMGNEMSAQMVLAALRAGADEFIDRDSGPEQINQSIEACLNRRGEPATEGRAKVIGVLSGIHSEVDQDFTLSLALRAAWQAKPGTVLYIDMSLPATQADVALALEMKFSVMNAIRELHRVDKVLLQSALARDPRSGLYVMPLSIDFREQQLALEAESFGALLQILRSIFDIIVIGYGPFSHQRALLEMVPTASFLLCCNQRFSSIRAASGLLGWFSELQFKGTPILVVHEMAPDLTPAPAEVCKALPSPHSVIIRGSWDYMAEQLNQNKPPALSDARYCRALDSCLGLAGLATAPEPKLGSKLRGWFNMQTAEAKP